QSEDEDISDPRKKWPAKYRCRDGHYVRSRAELLIDNWLYQENILHAYEKQVTFPDGQKAFCDFYLKEFNAYIEFWGKSDDYYLKRKNTKSALYNTLKDIKLIELDDRSLENLDDVLENYISDLK
ncbi:MAG: glycerol kinase, partial [Clostridia bacterium]|nr:glycerol kinase [Clostridia bacterium]